MRNVMILLFSLVVTAPVFAQYRPVANAGAFRAQFTTAAAATRTISSDFTQIKNLSVLAEKITAKGHFYFKKENKLRMEYTQPFQYTMAIDGNKVQIKDGSKTTTLSSKSNKMFQQLNQLLVQTAQGNVLSNTDFTSRLFEDGDGYLVEMTPVTAQLKSLFSKVNVIMNKKTFVVNKVQLFEPSGDFTSITYANQKINTEVPDALFSIH